MSVENLPNNNSSHDDTYEKMVMKQIREKELARAAMSSQAEGDSDDGSRLKDLVNDGLGDASADSGEEAGLRLKDLVSTDNSAKNTDDSLAPREEKLTQSETTLSDPRKEPTKPEFNTIAPVENTTRSNRTKIPVYHSEDDVLGTLGYDEVSDATLADRQTSTDVDPRTATAVDAEIKRRQSRGEYDWESSLEKGELEEDEVTAKRERASSRVADKIADFEDNPSFEPIRRPTRNPETPETPETTEATPAPEPNSEKPIENEATSLPPEFYIVSGDIYHNYEKSFKKNTKLLERSLASGVQRSIERGNFDTSENSLLRQGFWAEEEDRIQAKLDAVNDYSDAAFEAIRELKSRIGGLLDQESDKVSTAELSEAKYKGSLDAIRTGARSNGRSSKEVIFSIPPDQGEEAKEFMEEAGIDFENDDNIRTESYQGFINVIEEIKDKHDLTDDGFRALDWHFDNFNYAKNYDDFRDTLDSYTDQADLDFEDKWLEYLDYRDEIKSLQLAKLSRDQDTYDKIADFVEIASGQNFNDMEEEELFPMPDYNKPKQKSGDGGSASWPSSSEKIAAAYPKLEAITKIDPDATFYRGSIFKRDEHPYLVVRFGANGMNNVIVIPYGDDSDAMFAWHGETGDDRDGWKAYFKNTSIRTRNTEVERYQCNGYSKDPVDAMNREWDRIEKYLGIKLPDYTPASAPSGISIENQLFEAAEDAATGSGEKNA